jgi:hypothetical protein
MAYITLDALKSYLGVDTADDDLLLEGIIARAQGVIESPRPLGTGRKFIGETDTRYFYREDVDGKTLYMEAHDLLSVTSLTNGDGEVIPPSGFRLEPRNSTPYWRIRLLGDYYWLFDDRDSEITVTAVWGYSLTPPEAILQAHLRLAAWIYRQKDTGIEGDRVIISDGQTILPAKLPKDIDDLINPYRRKV